jgi:hypothetical protein
VPATAVLAGIGRRKREGGREGGRAVFNSFFSPLFVILWNEPLMMAGRKEGGREGGREGGIEEGQSTHSRIRAFLTLL